MGYYWNMNGLLVGIPISKQAPFRQILDRLQTELTQHMKNLRFLDHGAGNPRVTSGLRFYEGNVEQRQLGILRFWRDLKILTPHWQRTAQPVKSELVSEPVQLQIYIYKYNHKNPTYTGCNRSCISYINYSMGIPGS